MKTARPELNGSTVRISTGTTGLLIVGNLVADTLSVEGENPRALSAGNICFGRNFGTLQKCDRKVTREYFSK